MRVFAQPITFGLISAALMLTGCGGSSSSTDTVTPRIVNLPFAAMVNDEPVKCDTTYSGLGTSSTDVTIADFRLFIHDVAFITDQGEAIPLTLDATHPSQNSRVAQLDFRDTVGCEAEIVENDAVTNKNPHYNDALVGSATIDPRVTISQVRFTLGVPADLNHNNQADAEEPLRNPGMASSMAWNWQGGYKFTGLDVSPVGGVTRPSNATWTNTKWNVHLGSTNCPTTATELAAGTEPQDCAQPNRKVISLDLGATDWNDLVIRLDYAALVADSNLGQDDDGPSGCMSGQTDPECEQILAKLGLAWGENIAPAQAIFSVVAPAR